MPTLNDVKKDGDIDILAYHQDGAHCRYIEDLVQESIIFNGFESEDFVDFLSQSIHRNVIETELQSMVETNDGIRLLTALLPAVNFILLLQTTDKYNSIIEKIQKWIHNHSCNRVIIDFVDNRYS